MFSCKTLGKVWDEIKKEDNIENQIHMFYCRIIQRVSTICTISFFFALWKGLSIYPFFLNLILWSTGMVKSTH